MQYERVLLPLLGETRPEAGHVSESAMFLRCTIPLTQSDDRSRLNRTRLGSLNAKINHVCFTTSSLGPAMELAMIQKALSLHVAQVLYVLGNVPALSPVPKSERMSGDHVAGGCTAFQRHDVRPLMS